MNDDLIESIGLLCNSGDKCSVEAARLGDGNEKIRLCNKNKTKCQQETREVNTTLVQAY